MAVCNRCGIDRTEEHFYSSRPSTCKDCVKAAAIHRSRTNPMVQAYDRERAKTKARKAKARAITIRWRAENPDAYRAQTAVSNAVRDGRLTKEPCIFCGEKKVHAHHRDYAQPLNVIWLCPKCHHRLHGAFPEVEGRNKRTA